MRTAACVVGVVLLCACVAGAVTASYGWEDGGTICGQIGEIEASNVGSPYPVHSGSSSLMLVDMEPAGTPQAYIAWVAGLQEGDTLSVSFARFDTTPGGAPSCRLWAHYTATGGDIESYAASALGNSDYGPGEGWDVVNHQWTFESDGGARNGMVIECRTYSYPGDTVWIDDLLITAPDHALIQYNECRPVVDLTVTGIELELVSPDTVALVAQTAMCAQAAVDYIQTEIE